MRMQYFRKSSSSIRAGILTLILVLSIIETACGQDKPGDFQHELPPGVELVNPKDFGLTDADLGKFLGNVKVLGGGQVGDTKTQILTVGFDGDEDLNFDDFEIPGLTDKKSKEAASSSPGPDKDKEIANIAFEKFKEFFKDPKNAKAYDPSTQRSLPASFATISPNTITSNATPFLPTQSTEELSLAGTSTPTYKKIENDRSVYKQTFKDHGPKFLRQNFQQSLQQHYPVTLTQPIVSSTPRNPTSSNANRAVVSIQHHKPRPSTPPNYSNNNQGQQNHHQGINNNNVQKDYPPIEHREIASNYINNPVLPTQEQLQQQLFPGSNRKQNLFSSQGELATKLLNQGQESTTYRTILQHAIQGLSSTPQYTNDNSFHNQLIQKPYRPEPQYVPRAQSSPSPSVLPAVNNFQNFNLHTSQRPGNQQHHHLHHQQQKETSQSIGKIVRNQLVFNYPTENTSPYTNRVPPAAPTPSASVASPVLQKFPSIPQSNQQDQRPVSHVYINHNSHNSPVQQTSFHPRFQPPTRFVNNFTPSANQLTTPAPHFEVTPSVPMILISTNENAIKDPERTARLRQQQRHREEIRLREEQRQQELRLQEVARQNEIQLREQQQYEAEQQRQPHALNFQPQQQQQQQQQIQHNPQYQQQGPPQHQSQFQLPPNNNNIHHQHQNQHHQIQHQPSNHVTNFQVNTNNNNNNGPVPPPPQNFPNQNQHQIPPPTQNQPPLRQFERQPINNNNNPPIPTQYSTIHKFPHPVPDFEPTPQNSFNFQTQAQSHQLHALQPPPEPRYPSGNEQFQIPTYSTIFPQPQASNNYPQQQQIGPSVTNFPQRFPPARDNQFAYSTIRHKRGYRHRLSSLLRGLWRGGEREQ